MNYLLIKYKKDYADEFDVKGFMVSNEDDWNKHLSDVKRYFDLNPHTVERYFGSNEFVVYNDFEEYKRSFEIVNITSEEAETLNKLFNGTFGDVLLIEDFE
jgi:hypothetical protein